jgi:molybdopterin biosynthesis enzyme
MTSSKYPMVDVDAALSIVLNEAKAVALSRAPVAVSVTKARGLTLAESVVAMAPVPAFRTSILDGYYYYCC